MIDGRPIQAPGRIVSGVIQFSNDGEHFAYGTFVPDDEERGVAVWDGRVIPLEGGRVKYLGTRSGLEIEVIDNGMPEAQRPAMGAQ